MKSRVSEKVEQAHIVQLLRSIGATVYTLGTRRRRGDYPGTMQTPGIADVFAFLPPKTRQRWVLLAVEVKAEGGRLRPEQVRFRELCLWADVAYVVGPLDAVITWLVAEHYVQASQFPHYRQLKASAP
jgi:hypothetical protein